MFELRQTELIWDNVGSAGAPWHRAGCRGRDRWVRCLGAVATRSDDAHPQPTSHPTHGSIAFLGVLDLAYFVRAGMFVRERGGVANAVVVGSVLALAVVLAVRFV